MRIENIDLALVTDSLITGLLPHATYNIMEIY